MAQLHAITNPNPLLQRKVNFFADYFIYIIDYTGISENYPIENPLSIVENVIFQLENNDKEAKHIFIQNHLNSSFLKNIELMEEFENFKILRTLLDAYKLSDKKTKWIKSNPSFLSTLKILQKELEELMTKKSLTSIISFLTCEHEIQEHISDLKLHIQILVTEFLFSGRSKKMLKELLSRIITKDIEKFPFPESIKTKKQKIDFLSNQTFHQQFEGIYNWFIRKKNINTFFFRIYGLRTDAQFKFKYNKVTFYSNQHIYFDRIKTSLEKTAFNKFFLGGDFIIAAIKTEFYSIELGQKEAVRLIKNELKFLKITTDVNITIDSNNYLTTQNHKRFGGQYNLSNRVPSLDSMQRQILNDNPFNFLSKFNNQITNHIFTCEHLFIAALDSEKISDFWHYLEVLIPQKKDIKKTISSALLLNYDLYSEIKLNQYIFASISPFGTKAETLGLSIERQNHYYIQKNINLKLLRKETSHPFLKYILDEWKVSKKNTDLKHLKNYYNSILTEAYELRNSYLHGGIINEKSTLKIQYSLTGLINRFRRIIFYEITKNSHTSFEELIDSISLDK